MTPELAVLQGGLRDLVKGRPLAPGPAADAYLAQVSGSDRLVLVQEIAQTWRLVTLRSCCPLTMALLDRLGLTREEVARFTSEPGLPEHRRTAGRTFLEQVAGSSHPLVAALAGFELAVQTAATAGQDEPPVVQRWPCDPLPVLRALVAGEELGEQAPAPHRVEIGARIPGGFRVSALET